MIRTKYIAAVIVSIFLFSTAAVCEPTKQCGDLIKECFSSSGTAQSNCLFAASRHPFCDGTALGKLSYKRWLMSPVKAGSAEAPPAFLGPQLVDQNCLANFDNSLMALLIKETASGASFEKLEERLLSCTSEIANSLTRP
jgi:hypothetical protein